MPGTAFARPSILFHEQHGSRIQQVRLPSHLTPCGSAVINGAGSHKDIFMSNWEGVADDAQKLRFHQ
jgi:hypothetical protein